MSISAEASLNRQEQPQEAAMGIRGKHANQALRIARSAEPTGSRWLSLMVLCAGFLMIVVDMTIVNVALPSIRRDLGFSQAGLAWVVNAYLIAYGGLLLLGGGLITQAISWHWICFVNLPIGLATALVATHLLDTDSGIGLREGADVIGAFLVTVGLMLAVYTIVESANYGLGSFHTLGFGALALGPLVPFLLPEMGAHTPT